MKEALHALEEVKQAIQLAYSSGYSAGKQQRKWQMLPDAEIQAIHDAYYRRMGPHEFARAIEAALKERNT
jgi:hypothetical protein